MLHAASAGENAPTGFSLIRDWALVFAADMAAGEEPANVPKNRDRKEVIVTVGRVLLGKTL